MRVQGFSSSFTTRAVKSSSAARTAPGAVPPATPRRASADSSVSTVLRSRPNAGENAVEFFKRHLADRFPFLLRRAQHLANNFVRLAKRNALRGKIIGDFGGDECRVL